MMKNKLWFIGLIAALFLLGGGMAMTLTASSASGAGAEMSAVAPTAPQAPLAYTTVITVNTTEDTSGETQTKTCYFNQSIYFAASDGKCNLRRALVEASHRPEAQRPILIKFNIPITDTNYNAITGTWTIVMDADYSSSAGGEAIVQGGLDNPKNPDSYVTIDGATQSEIGGRSNGDPIIIIHSEHVLDLVAVNYNTIRNLAFNGGGGIFSNDVSGVGGNNLIENVWVGLNADGTEIVPGSNPDISLAGGGISIQGDNNTISNTIVTGSNVGISIEGDNNLIQYNTIGTRGDRTIPAERLTCVASNLYNPAQWYGGWGINITSGSNNMIVHNTSRRRALAPLPHRDGPARDLDGRQRRPRGVQHHRHRRRRDRGRHLRPGHLRHRAGRANPEQHHRQRPHQLLRRGKRRSHRGRDLRQRRLPAGAAISSCGTTWCATAPPR